MEEYKLNDHSLALLFLNSSCNLELKENEKELSNRWLILGCCMVKNRLRILETTNQYYVDKIQ